MDQTDAPAATGAASDNPASRNESADAPAPAKRTSRRRRTSEAEQAIAEDFASAAYPVDAPQPLLVVSHAEIPAHQPEDLALVADGTPLLPADAEPERTEAQAIADEIEAQKVWTLAGVIRAANTAWGIDEGIDADVREARALMEEARRQVREKAPIGVHYRADGPDLRRAA